MHAFPVDVFHLLGSSATLSERHGSVISRGVFRLLVTALILMS
jgi:hypothetical protein